jgi:Ser/Thr protein kinase RdoA (MazF antagonist)
MALNDIFAIAEQFTQWGRVREVNEYGHGNINDTFLVALDFSKTRFDTCPYFILQRINTRVFRQPELVLLNMRIITEHIRTRLQDAPPISARGWEVPHLLSTRDGKDYWIDSEGSFWRAMSFIDNAQSYDTIEDIERARKIGYAIGLFHNLLSDLSPDRLADTLEGFHITPRYLQHYEEVLSTHGAANSAEVNHCMRFVKERSAWAHVLENGKTKGRLNIRPIHGDPKVNNIMMDRATGDAVSIIDLDTVKPGLVHYDIGDCLRSGCNPLGEEVEGWERVHFEADCCQAILQGYLSTAREFLTDHDYDYLFDSIRLIAFELGLRFFTDYLEGNVYFKAIHPEHNLNRALVQFRLTESIESQEQSIRSIILDLK